MSSVLKIRLDCGCGCARLVQDHDPEDYIQLMRVFRFQNKDCDEVAPDKNKGL